MAKFTGFMCDSCGKAENGNDRPEEWLGVMLPTQTNQQNPEVKDLCSDKCLLKFARERAGTGYTRPTKSKVPGLSEFLDARGIKPSQKGALSATHTRRRHEMNGGVEDCLVCEFLTNREIV